MSERKIDWIEDEYALHAQGCGCCQTKFIGPPGTWAAEYDTSEYPETLTLQHVQDYKEHLVKQLALANALLGVS